MGFWHTGYLEFHEPSGIEEWCQPAPPIYSCSHCGKQFDVADDWRRHRFEEHPFKRPLLFIRGSEVGSTPLTITRAIDPGDVATGACGAAIVNGVRMPVDQLAGTLASVEHDIVRVVLEGDGTTASFEVRIELASDEDMAGVEQAFLDVARHRRLDMRAIEHFINAASGFETAVAYCDGVCEYLYGVLAKERSPESSLPYEAYREKFSRALDKLGTFDRHLANRIGGLIEFHFNHFAEAAVRSPASRVAYAATVFNSWLYGAPPGELGQGPIEDDVRLESLLTDWDTEQLVRWAVRDTSSLRGEQAQMEKMLRGTLAEFDQTKLHVLLAQIGLASKNRSLVLTHARELRNRPGFARWADAALEASNDWGEH